MKKKALILTLICFGVILISMFLPFCEGPRKISLIPKDSFAVIEIYDSPDFGIRLWVFNGFGSLFALVNLVIAFVLVLSRFFFPGSLPIAVLSACAFIISLAALIYSTSDNHSELLPDEMLTGFYLMLVSQVILITQSFTTAITGTPKLPKHDSDLLDF